MNPRQVKLQRPAEKPRPKGIPPLIPFMVGVFILFIGILIFAYVETKKANPQMLDEKGHVVRS